jgi:hypothetical protein
MTVAKHPPDKTIDGQASINSESDSGEATAMRANDGNPTMLARSKATGQTIASGT